MRAALFARKRRARIRAKPAMRDKRALCMPRRHSCFLSRGQEAIATVSTSISFELEPTRKSRVPQQSTPLLTSHTFILLSSLPPYAPRVFCRWLITPLTLIHPGSARFLRVIDPWWWTRRWRRSQRQRQRQQQGGGFVAVAVVARSPSHAAPAQGISYSGRVYGKVGMVLSSRTGAWQERFLSPVLTLVDHVHSYSKYLELYGRVDWVDRFFPSAGGHSSTFDAPTFEARNFYRFLCSEDRCVDSVSTRGFRVEKSEICTTLASFQLK